MILQATCLLFILNCVCHLGVQTNNEYLGCSSGIFLDELSKANFQFCESVCIKICFTWVTVFHLCIKAWYNVFKNCICWEHIETDSKTSEPEKVELQKLTTGTNHLLQCFYLQYSAVADPHFWGEIIFKDQLLAIFKTLLI
jgi:hypothetical protein